MQDGLNITGQLTNITPNEGPLKITMHYRKFITSGIVEGNLITSHP